MNLQGIISRDGLKAVWDSLHYASPRPTKREANMLFLGLTLKQQKEWIALEKTARRGYLPKWAEELIDPNDMEEAAMYKALQKNSMWPYLRNEPQREDARDQRVILASGRTLYGVTITGIDSEGGVTTGMATIIHDAYDYELGQRMPYKTSALHVYWSSDGWKETRL